MSRSTLAITSLLLALSAPAMSAQVSEGQYIAILGDCVACHTTNSDQPLAGGMAFPTPVGDVYSTNITPDKTHGIGAYTLEDFIKVMRNGVAKEGHNLYPAMPYTSYAKMHDADLEALYRYLMDEVEPQAVANRPTDIVWPLSMRWPLAVWKWFYHDDSQFEPDSKQSDEWNRGAYLVQGAGHCGTCHTPRGFAMQELALDGTNDKYLKGAELDGWYAGDIRGDLYSQEEMVALLKTGRSDKEAVLGPMAEVITHSSQHFREDDLNSIVTYVRSLSATPVTAPTQLAQASESAKTDYKMYCGTCHGSDGAGRDHIIPALAGNSTVLADNPASLVNILLHGGQTATTKAHIGYNMPAYDWKFNDQQAADLLNYIRASWGNQGAPVSAQNVKAQR